MADRLFTVKFELPEILDVEAEDPEEALQRAWDYVVSKGVKGLNGHSVEDQAHPMPKKGYNSRLYEEVKVEAGEEAEGP